jgi:hypothetical protein
METRLRHAVLRKFFCVNLSAYYDAGSAFAELLQNGACMTRKTITYMYQTTALAPDCCQIYLLRRIAAESYCKRGARMT